MGTWTWAVSNFSSLYLFCAEYPYINIYLCLLFYALFYRLREMMGIAKLPFL